MPLDLLITNATVVNAGGRTHCHVGVADGVIAGLYHTGTRDLPASRRTIDATGNLLIPGGVDGHCHVEQITGSYKSLDTFQVATTAALHGGTTTIIDFGIPATPEETPRAAVENKLALLEGARCDVALHGAVVAWHETVPAQLEWMAQHGIRSVKLYTTNRGTTMADDDTIVNVMKEMVRLDGLTYIHSEHDAIIEDRVATCAHNHQLSVSHLHETRPTISEDSSVREVLAMAQYTGAPVYFVHQTTPEAVDAVRQARAQGQSAYSETCPHYLGLDESVYASPAPEKFACCPPMRPRASVEGLLDRVAWGHVDTISSDHSCYDLSQKRQRSDDVRKMPHGLPGVETRMPAAFTTLVRSRRLSVERFVELFATAPAGINGLDTKGVVAVGYDADLVLFDPDEARTVDGASLHMGTDFSPFDGVELVGWPSTVVSAGRVVLDDGVFVDPGSVGRFVPRRGVSEQGSARAEVLV
ncbi:dihydroorotase [Pseudonocardia nigra]|uniref:dihydroorotase n=1 Tax=Pseudonocardia nigra TaxID=1921578 RepID=UPI001C600A95|nr:amidohydrolase family protein [Pseudonocardia nigra]